MTTPDPPDHPRAAQGADPRGGRRGVRARRLRPVARSSATTASWSTSAGRCACWCCATRTSPTYVAHGAADVGVAGSDVLDEEGRDLYEPLDLGIGRCRMIVAERADARIDDRRTGAPPGRHASTRASPGVPPAHGLTAEVIKLSGAIELGPLTGLCDRIVDITQTGETLRQNGLVEVDTVCAGLEPPGGQPGPAQARRRSARRADRRARARGRRYARSMTAPATRRRAAVYSRQVSSDLRPFVAEEIRLHPAGRLPGLLSEEGAATRVAAALPPLPAVPARLRRRDLDRRLGSPAAVAEPGPARLRLLQRRHARGRATRRSTTGSR